MKYFIPSATSFHLALEHKLFVLFSQIPLYTASSITLPESCFSERCGAFL